MENPIILKTIQQLHADLDDVCKMKHSVDDILFSLILKYKNFPSNDEMDKMDKILDTFYILSAIEMDIRDDITNHPDVLRLENIKGRYLRRSISAFSMPS